MLTTLAKIIRRLSCLLSCHNYLPWVEVWVQYLGGWRACDYEKCHPCGKRRNAVSREAFKHEEIWHKGRQHMLSIEYSFVNGGFNSKDDENIFIGVLRRKHFHKPRV